MKKNAILYALFSVSIILMLSTMAGCKEPFKYDQLMASAMSNSFTISIQDMDGNDLLQNKELGRIYIYSHETRANALYERTIRAGKGIIEVVAPLPNRHKIKGEVSSGDKFCTKLTLTINKAQIDIQPTFIYSSHPNAKNMYGGTCIYIKEIECDNHHLTSDGYTSQIRLNLFYKDGKLSVMP